MVRDSDGVRIVEYPSSGLPRSPPFTIAAAPVVTIGDGTTNSVDLGDVRGAVRFRDGTLLIADGEHCHVDLVDTAGRLRARIGSRGLGTEPGEFNGILSVFPLPGDLAGVWDGGNHELSVFDRAGRIVRWRRFAAPPYQAIPGQTGRLRLIRAVEGAFDDGTMLAWTWLPYTNAGYTHVYTDSATVEAIPSHGAPRTLRTVVLADNFVSRRGRGADGALPFGRVGCLAIDHAAWYYTDGSGEVRQYASGGRLLGIIRFDEPAAAVTPSDIAAYRERHLSRLDPRLRQAYRAALDSLRYPATRPRYTALRMDHTGDLWARRFSFDGDPAIWDVFTAAGGYLGSATVPPDQDVLDISSDYVVAMHVDTLGNESLREYRIQRPR